MITIIYHYYNILGISGRTLLTITQRQQKNKEKSPLLLLLFYFSFLLFIFTFSVNLLSRANKQKKKSRQYHFSWLGMNCRLSSEESYYAECIMPFFNYIFLLSPCAFSGTLCAALAFYNAQHYK